MRELLPLKNEAIFLPRTFSKLFTPEGYKIFIKRSDQLANQMKQLTSNVSLQLSYSRENAKSVYMFTMAGLYNLTEGIQIYNSSEFTLNYLYMYKNLSKMTKQSLLTVDQLSFDVIATVVAAEEVLEYYENVTSNFEAGGSFIFK